MPSETFRPSRPLRRLLACLVPGLPTLARAADTPELAGSLGQMLFGLAVVLALLVGTLWLLKKLSNPRGASAGMKVLGATAIGPRERVVLLEVGEEVLLIGVAPGYVRTLHTLRRDQLPQAPAATGSAEPPPFAGWLRQAMERKRHEG